MKGDNRLYLMSTKQVKLGNGFLTNSADLMGMVLQITSKLSVVQAVSVFNLRVLGKNLWRQGRNPLSLFLKKSGIFKKLEPKTKRRRL